MKLSNNHSDEKSIENNNEIFKMILYFQRLIDIIRDNSDLDGICRLKKTDITKLDGISYTGTH